MPFMRLSYLPTVLVLAACARNNIADQGASVVSSKSVHLRNTFDTDPGTYIGRFVPAGVTDLDESNTLILACSKHIQPRFIDGGGVAFAETVNVSTQVAARIGIPVIADASASHDASRTARAEYVLTGKLVAEIPDPEAFAACCKAQPDQCTDRYIGEFIQGTGSLLHQAANSTKVEASGTNPQTGVSGGGGLDRSAEWQRVAEFQNPVYFAFKVSPTAYTQGAVDTCPAWANQVPQAEGGVYVVGRGDNARNEQRARNDALQHANAQAMQAAGLAWHSLAGAPIPIRAEQWCVTPTRVRRSTRYSARVLAFVSNDSIAEAKKTAEANAAAQREQERLAAEREQARLAAERDAAAKQPTTAPPPGPTEPAPPPGTPAAGPGDVDRIVAAVEAESFADGKLSALEFSARGARITAAEARRVIDLFTYSGDKLKALTTLRGAITDPANWNQVVDAFTHSSDRDAARKLAP
jgi:hypothetical protein